LQPHGNDNGFLPFASTSQIDVQNNTLECCALASLSIHTNHRLSECYTNVFLHQRFNENSFIQYTCELAMCQD